MDGADCYLQSRNAKPLGRYFPELQFPKGRYVLDGELVILDSEGGQEFDALQQRIHPALSRIERLARELPARFVAFDLLALDDRSLLEEPFERRRAELEELVVAKPVELTPTTRDPAQAEPWLQGAEGVVAKQLDAPYRPGERTGMVKVKRVRTIDTVVVGWRPGKEAGTLGSLILGLYDKKGELHVVGHASRWTAGRELEWISVRPELVVEVSFDHVSAGRIRHGAKVVRWREDKKPRECTVDQLDS